MKLDCVELTKTIIECFDNSLDNRFSSGERKEFLVQGKKLRGSLVNLLSADFNEGTIEVVEANKSIKEINEKLKEKDRILDCIAAIFSEISKLVSILDDTLKLAAGYV